MVFFFSDLYPIAKHYYFKLLYQIFPKIKYQKEVKNQTFWSFSYLNFWDDEDLSEFWLARFIQERNLNPKGKKIYFISCFGNPKSIDYAQDGVKIFFTAEYIGPERYREYQDHMLGKVDLSLGFRDDIEDDLYLRFPFYLFHLLEPSMRKDEIQQMIQTLSTRDPSWKFKFTTLIARHDMWGIRTQAYEAMFWSGKIDCPSRLFHNIDIELPDYESKRKFLSPYRYTICPENIIKPGYVTEKIADALRAKCIPVYSWGLSERDKKVFNPDSILRIDKDLGKKVAELEQNNDKFQDFYSLSPFMPTAAQELENWLDELEKKLRIILDD